MYTNLPTSQGYIFRILQHFGTKICSFSNFDNFFPEISFVIPRLKIFLKRKSSIGAERELKEAWEKIDRSELHKNGVENDLTWVFGTADSPWHQGAVESFVKAAKRAIRWRCGAWRVALSTLCRKSWVFSGRSGFLT